MESPFASYMERWRIEDKSVARLMDVEDDVSKAIKQKGYDHENAFLEKLRSDGREFVFIEGDAPEPIRERTREAMRSGVDVIAQAYLELDNFGGYADFLVRKSGKSKLGDFHYEVWDTKLSRKMKPYFAIQLCCYAEMLEQEQGIPSERVAIVLGDDRIAPLKTRSYVAYYNSLKSSFLNFQENWSVDHPPNPADSSSFDRWSNYAEQILAERRHLSLVANITRTQIKRLESVDITTIDDLADTKLTTAPKINRDAFKRLKAQAQIQMESEGRDKPKFKVLPHEKKASDRASPSASGFPQRHILRYRRLSTDRRGTRIPVGRNLLRLQRLAEVQGFLGARQRSGKTSLHGVCWRCSTFRARKPVFNISEPL